MRVDVCAADHMWSVLVLPSQGGEVPSWLTMLHTTTIAPIAQMFATVVRIFMTPSGRIHVIPRIVLHPLACLAVLDAIEADAIQVPANLVHSNRDTRIEVIFAVNTVWNFAAVAEVVKLS
jgi:hypothetical protein